MRRFAFVAKVLVATAVTALAVGGASPAMAWLHPGSTTVYPASGGTWQYGFWNAKVRSYYTVNTTHGSTVIYNGTTHRSICTASNQRSVAEAWAINTPGASDQYFYRFC